VSLVLSPFAAVTSMACLLDDLLISTREIPSSLLLSQLKKPWALGHPMHMGSQEHMFGGSRECILMPTKQYEKQSEKLLQKSHIIIQSN